MLSLRLFGEHLYSVAPGSRFQLPNGDIVSPAYAGWVGPEGHELVEVPPQPAPALTTDDVDVERDRRLYGVFYFQGRPFDADRDSQMRIAGAALNASIAISMGAEAGNLYWTGSPNPFAWIAADNSLVTMDAPTTIAFGQAAAAHITAHIFAARAIKVLDPIPLDYTDPSRWP